MHVFTVALAFFQHGKPHETSYFTIRKLLFHFFFVFWYFSLKNIEKITSKCKDQLWIPKSTQNAPREPVLGPKMVPNSRRSD